MASASVLDIRLRNQALVASPHSTPEQVVAWLGAVQAQDYVGAAWAVSLRAHGLTLTDVDAAPADGRILRTHVLRPTWHLVAPADIRWMLALTAPRVHAAMRSYDRRLDLDSRVYTKARRLIVKALEGGHTLTRPELSQILQRGGIEASGQRLAHIMMHAELEADVCSGPRRDSRFTYALLAERAPGARILARDEALGTLAQRFFRSHGPATVRDFAWWSGLTMVDARAGVRLGADSDMVIDAPSSAARAPGAHVLLPNYDEYLVAYKDRAAVIDPDRVRNLGVYTRAEFPHQLIVDGRVGGSWARVVGRSSATVRVHWYRPPSASHRRGIAASATRFGAFLGRPCTVEIASPDRTVSAG